MNATPRTFDKFDVAIGLAHRHEDKRGDIDSANFCIVEAYRAYDREDLDAAYAWAIKSLEYSVGVFHKDYTTALEAA